MKFIVVLDELLQSLKGRGSKKIVNETMTIKHKYVQFLKHTDFRIELREHCPDLVASIGQKYSQIELTGPASQVRDATAIISEKIRRICEKPLTLQESKLVWNIVAKNRWNEYFTRKLGEQNIKAIVSLIQNFYQIEYHTNKAACNFSSWSV